jgi:hypothetical protein
MSENRHFGKDAEIQAMDGNQSAVQVPDSRDLPSPFTRSSSFPRSALVVIHKCWKPVISAWMPKSSVHGRQTLAYYIAQMKHLYKLQVTVHGLDTGIPAGMTAFFTRSQAPGP